MEPMLLVSMTNKVQSNETRSISSLIGRNITVHFGSFGIGYIPQELLNKIKDKFITHNIKHIIQTK